MTDPPWDEVHHLLGPDRMGALPDLRIPGTSVADWQPQPG